MILTYRGLWCFSIVFLVAGSAILYNQFMGGSSSRSKKMSASAVRIPSKEKATASLIFLHGLGDTGHGWAEQFKDFGMKDVRCVCPNAAMNPVTLNMGMTMPSWFDIKSLNPQGPEDEAGIVAASKLLKDLINKEVSDGIPAERIIIGGFSQGGAVAVYTAFATNVKIGGVVALSTWLPLNKKFTDSASVKYNTGVPVFQAHGEADPVVAFTWGAATHEIIKGFNPSAIFKTYSNMGHSSSPQEMQDVQNFLQQVLNKS